MDFQADTPHQIIFAADLMMSIHEGNVSRLNSRDSLSSGQRVRLCHMCGLNFPKTSLASHQRRYRLIDCSCIRKSIGIPRRAIATLSAGNKAFYPCSKCSYRFDLGSSNVPQHKMRAHVHECQELQPRNHSGAGLYDLNDDPVPKMVPSSAPLTRRSTISYNSYPNRDEHIIKRKESYSSHSYYEQDDGGISLAVAAESITFNQSFGLPKQPVLKSKVSNVEYKPKTKVSPSLEKCDRKNKVTLQVSQSNPTPHDEYDNEEFENLTNEVPYPSYHENSEIERLDVSQYLITCEICNRKFMQDRIDKHKTICMKTNSKSRKVFDERAARVKGTDLEKYVLKKDSGNPEKTKQPKTYNWRVKHQAFQNMLLAAKLPKGSKPPAPSVNIDPNPDYITCPCCERRFNEESGKRHIPICKEKANKKALETKNGQKGKYPKKDKAEELKRRIGYKPPSPRKQKQK